MNNRFGSNEHHKRPSQFNSGNHSSQHSQHDVTKGDGRRRTFRVDPADYRPIRVGIRCEQKVIVIEYRLKSQQGKRFHHNIKMYRYSDPMAFGISVSRSGSFREALH